MAKLTLNSIFDRVDHDHDGKLSYEDVQQFITDAGVGKTDTDTWFGWATNSVSSVVNIKLATDTFMSTFDTNQTGTVSLEEFKAHGMTLLPGPEVSVMQSGVSLRGHLKAHARTLCGEIDADHKGFISCDDLTTYAARTLTEAGAYLVDVKAKEGAKIAIRLLDEAGSGQVAIEDIEELAEEIDSQLEAADALTAPLGPE